MGLLDLIFGTKLDGDVETDFVGGGETWTGDFIVRGKDGRIIGQGDNPREVNTAIRAAGGASKVGWVERNSIRGGKIK